MGGFDGNGGGGKGYIIRGPQSAQSVPNSQNEYCESGPPSLHSPFPFKSSCSPS